MDYTDESVLCLLVGEGLSTYKIADTLGVAQSTVRYWLTKYGLKTNPIRVMEETSKRFCPVCSAILTNPRSTYCSTVCQREFIYNSYIKRWLHGEEDGIRGSGYEVSRHIYRYLKKKSAGGCAICGTTKWLGKEILLVLDHINGDASDNGCNNLRLICSNCDAQLPTYKSRNKGNGRHSRMVRYREGRSY